MANRTALKVAAGVGGAVLVLFVARLLVAWVLRLVRVAGIVLLAAALAYVAYRVVAALRGRGTSEDTREAASSQGRGPLAGLDVGDGTDADDDAAFTDEEFERELEELREDA
jgi:threonine/homoserine/homoserine lactone efflux protein